MNQLCKELLVCLECKGRKEHHDTHEHLTCSLSDCITDSDLAWTELLISHWRTRVVREVKAVLLKKEWSKELRLLVLKKPEETNDADMKYREQTCFIFHALEIKKA